MDINVGALVAVVLFYIIVLGVGLWAARLNRDGDLKAEDLMLAGRKLGAWTGAFTTTATWVGGGYINGIVEVVFTGGSGAGLAWCQGPFGYSLSLLFGGLFFAKPMRRLGYVTMLDPFSQKLGSGMAALLFLPALLGELMWSASTLASLGETATVIIGIGYVEAIVASTCVVIVYTVIGGLWSVAHTDTSQLVFMFMGLCICAPFSLTYTEAVKPLWRTKSHWLGTIEVHQIGTYIDKYLMLIFGGIPWQVYFQRVHAAKSALHAQNLSFIAAAACLIISVPSILMGAAAASTDWNRTEFGRRPLPNEVKMVLPLVLNYLVPKAVAVVGLVVVCAAVISSADSSILSTGVDHQEFRLKASDNEVLWCMRASLVWIGAAVAAIGILVPAVYDLWYLCSDLVYVVLFPQLTAIIYLRDVNTYGSLLGYIVGVLLRLLGGEDLIGLPAVVRYPYFSDQDGQLFPFRTFSMISGFLCIAFASKSAKWIFVTCGLVPLKYDFLHAFRYNTSTTAVSVSHQAETHLALQVLSENK